MSYRRRLHCLHLLGCLRYQEARAHTEVHRLLVSEHGGCDILLVGVGRVLVHMGELGVPLVLLLLLA